MVCDGLFHGRILAEVGSDGHILAALIFLRLLGVDGATIPSRARPSIAREGLLHAEAVVGILGQFRLAIAGLQNELCQRDRCEDTAGLLGSSEERADLGDDISFGHIL